MKHEKKRYTYRSGFHDVTRHSHFISHISLFLPTRYFDENSKASHPVLVNSIHLLDINCEDGWMILTWNTYCPYGFLDPKIGTVPENPYVLQKSIEDPKIRTGPRKPSTEIHYRETGNFPYRFLDRKIHLGTKNMCQNLPYA